MSEIDQNKPKLDVNNSNLYRNAAKSYTYVMKEEEVLSKMMYRSLLYVLPVLNYEGLYLAHFWICRKLTKVSQNWMWIIQIWEETLQSVIEGMKEEDVLSKNLHMSLPYV